MPPARRATGPQGRLTRWPSPVPQTWAMMLVFVVVLLANTLYLGGVFDPNPLGQYSGLGNVHRGWLGGFSTLDSNAGLVSQTLGHLSATDLLHLRLPWWNPFEGTGAPLAGEMQSAALFPPTLLTELSNGQLYEHVAFELVAALSTFALLRRLALGLAASTAGAIAFGLNGTFAWLSNAVVNPVAFLPLLLLGIELVYSAAREGRHGGWWLLALAGALSVYAGFPEVAYINALLGAVWVLWRASALRGRAVREFARKVLLAAAVGALLSAPQLIAFVDYLPHAYLSVHASSTLGAAHLSHLSLAQLVLPYVYGPPDGRAGLYIWALVGGYLTTSLLFLALAGLCLPGRHRGLRVALLGWIALALSAIYHVPPFMWRLLAALPGLSHVELVRYSFASLELAVVVLAALGLQGIIAGAGRRGPLLLAAAGSGLLLWLAVRQSAGLHFPHWFSLSVAWGGLALGGATVAAMLPARAARGILLTALVGVEALSLFIIPELSAPTSVQVDLAPVAFLRRHLGDQRFFTLGPLVPNYGTYFGLASINDMDVPVSSPFARFVRSRLDPGSDPTGFTGQAGLGGAPPPDRVLVQLLAGYRDASVSYVVASPGERLAAGDGLQLVFADHTAWIYHLGGARPYAGTDDPRCRVSSEGRTSVRTSCPEASTLVRRETLLPGWSATLDGRPVAIAPRQGIFQAVRIPAGDHRVDFSFTPPGEGWGLLAFLTGLAALCAPPVLLRRRAYPRRPRTWPSDSATRDTWPSLIPGKNGSAIERAATSSQTGNSPSRWPKRSR